MRRHLTRLFGAVAIVGAVSVLTAAVMPDATSAFHERKEVAGLFGAEPEPALTEEMQNLFWRMTSLASEEPYTELKDASVVVTFEGGAHGPFDLRPVRDMPGRYQTRHIFTSVGEYETLLSFQKGEETAVHTVDFNFRIGDRADMEIPKRRGGN